MRALWRFVGRTVAWVVILAAGATIAACVLIPRATGATPYTILTGSMEPGYPAGTVVVVRPVDPAELSVGDVVTVQLESGQDTMVTHRIVAVQHRMDGQTQFITQGDANDIPDADPRLPVQIRGEVWYRVPYVGYVSTALTGAQRGWFVTGAALALLAYAVWMFASAWRDRRSASSSARHADGACGTTDPSVPKDLPAEERPTVTDRT